jgi:hypothetical protein
MRATITDSETIDTISPVDLASYLRVHGWRRGREIGGGLAQTWFWPGISDEGSPAETVDVIVPADREMRDFRRRVSETLRTLEEIERRSQLDILSDIQNVLSDVVRWRWIEASAGDGTIPLELGHALFGHVRNQVLAAACSAAEPRQFFASRKPAPAIEYLRQARLGQSERGSYVVTVHSPVPPAVPAPDIEDDTEPFERRVTLMLSKGLHALRRAASEAVNGAPSISGSDLAREGVSANLCESVAAMLSAGGVRRDIEVRFSFSGSRPAPDHTPAITRFSSDLSPVIGEIGKVLRETATREDFELEGFVTNLNRGPLDHKGIAVVQGLVDNDYKRVEIEAGTEDYDAIVAPAHKDRKMIRCEGELQKVKGKTYRLKNARGFRILSTD